MGDVYPPVPPTHTIDRYIAEELAAYCEVKMGGVKQHIVRSLNHAALQPSKCNA